MSFLSEIKEIIEAEHLPVETAFYSDSAPSAYAVITPISDDYDVFAGDLPTVETCEVRVSIFTKGNYLILRDNLSRAFLRAGWVITERQFIDFEPDTGYSHYEIDVANFKEAGEF